MITASKEVRERERERERERLTKRERANLLVKCLTNDKKSLSTLKAIASVEV